MSSALMTINLQHSVEPAQIKTNIPKLKTNIQELLRKFEYIVDEEGIKDAKTQTTELNKLKNALNTARRDIVAEASLPIKKFETEIKDIINDVDSARNKLLTQIEKFNNEAKAKLEKLFESKLQELFDIHKVDKEFQKTRFDDLVILSNLTKGGKITKNALDELTCRVLKNKDTQDKIYQRVSLLAQVSMDAGLKSSITRRNVESFLMIEDDRVYEQKLSSLIEDEKQREFAAIRAVRSMDLNSTPIPQKEEAQNTPQEEQTTTSIQESQTVPSANKKTYIVTAVFEVEIVESKRDQLPSMLKDKFEKTGWRSIPYQILVEEKSKLPDGSLF
jgi:hypothetical protein